MLPLWAIYQLRIVMSMKLAEGCLLSLAGQLDALTGSYALTALLNLAGPWDVVAALGSAQGAGALPAVLPMGVSA
jgi:hypothetical protein